MKTPQANRTRIRLTVDLRPEVYESFRVIAEAQRLGIGRTIGDWLESTEEAARFTAQIVSEAKANPKRVAERLHGYAAGLAVEAEGLIAAAKGAGVPDMRSRAATPDQRPPPSPPLGNTGGKVPSRKGKPS
jgi:hypothetical protein